MGVDPDKPGLASDAYDCYTDQKFEGVLGFGPVKQGVFDLDGNPVSDAVFADMSAEEKADTKKAFPFVVSNSLEQIDMTGQSKKKQIKMLKKAMVKYIKKGIIAKWGEGKNPDKKAFKTAAGLPDGLLGANGFVVGKVLADPTDFDYYCAPEKIGEALSGDAGIVVCEWTGAADAVFYVIEVGVKAQKY